MNVIVRSATLGGVLTLITASSLSCAPRFRALNHSPAVAAREAQTFADLAFVDQDFKQAHGLLSTPIQETYSLDRFESEIARMHPSEHPSAVRATEFEPIPGQAAMNILLLGESAGEKFYYRLLMTGTVDDGYKVGGFFRGNRAYPASKLRRSLSN